MSTPTRPVAVILAGGRATRMGGVNKALQVLAGEPLLAHILKRLRPQSSRILLSVENPDPCWNEFALTQVPDRLPGSEGPLAAVYSALAQVVLDHEESESLGMLLVPCDAPFIPPDLAERLMRAACAAGVGTALVAVDGVWQPTFSYWETGLLPGLEKAVIEQGMRGLREFLQTVPHAIVDWEPYPADPGTGQNQPPPFFNINSPEELALAEQWASSGTD